MMFTDNSRGRDYAKNPAVIKFNGRYFLYYSIGPYIDDRIPNPWCIDIAESTDLVNWNKIGEITPEWEIETKSICAPGVVVMNGKVHLFYQTYGNGLNDAICHDVLENGLDFATRDPDFKIQMLGVAVAATPSHLTLTLK